MSQAATYQCPNCNGVLTYDASTGLLTCMFCDATFAEGEVEKTIPVGDGSVKAQATDHVKTVDEFLEHAPWASATNAVSYSCPSCGAGVVADQSAVTASCPYCGNNMIVSGIANAGNVPEWVLPFSVSREQAEAQLREHFQHKWYLSRKFDASLEHIQGVYVPYHLYDIRVWGSADYIGYHEESDDDGPDRKTYNAMSRSGYALFEKIPVDGSSKMPDAHMDAIAPFSFDQMRDFSTSYIAGYLTEVPDESAEECMSRARNRAVNTFESDLSDDAKSERNVDGIERVVRRETGTHLEDVSSCVLPVWLMHCTWNDNQMLFAVNGETGKCVGDLPIDGKRRVATVAGLALAVVIIAALLFLTVLSGGDGDDKFKFVAGAVLFAFLVPLFGDIHFKGQMRTAVESTSAEMSYSSEGLVITERWSTRKFYMRKGKAEKMLEEYRLAHQ